MCILEAFAFAELLRFHKVEYVQGEFPELENTSSTDAFAMLLPKSQLYWKMWVA